MTITLTNDHGTLTHREAQAHHELMRLVERYPDSQTTYDMVLTQLTLVRDLNRMMDRDQKIEDAAVKHGVDPDYLRSLIKREVAPKR